MNFYRKLTVCTIFLGLVAGCGTDSTTSPAEKNAEQPDVSARPAVEGITHIETVAKSPTAEISIPYSKYALDNGLTVILHEDRSDPIAHVDVTYHVGSAREEVGKSGFAHFFEHMMFQGSENVGDDAHFKIVTESGGTLNGTTNPDRTNYYQTVPANQLEKMLWLEADRMGFFLDAVTQEKFEIQRATVKNERGQNYDNRPYGLLHERTGEVFYPPGHPYAHMTIGYIEDLNRVDVNDLKAFFLRWYGPNNATLTIGGNIDVDQTLEWIVKYFGPIPRGPEVEDAQKQPVTLDKDIYVSYEDTIPAPYVYMRWPTVYRFHEDQPALDLLARLISQGEGSVLKKALVESGMAVSASASHSCAELACSFSMSGASNPASGATLADIEATIRKSLLEFQSRGIGQDDLERVRTKIVADFIRYNEQVSGKVSQLAFYETFADNPRMVETAMAKVEAVTVEDIERALETYFLEKPVAIMSIVPKGQSDKVAAPDTQARPVRDIPEFASVEESDLEYRRAPETFDRSIMPAAGKLESPEPPKPWRASLDNGIRVIGAKNDEVPLTSLSIIVEAGQLDEPLDKLGVASLTAQALNQSTNQRSKSEIDDELQRKGASLGWYPGTYETTIQVSTLTRELGDVVAIAAEQLLDPKFDEAEFQRIKEKALESVQRSASDPSKMASTAFNKLLFGTENAIGWPSSGTEKSIASITLDDVKAFYETFYAPSLTRVVAVSSDDQSAVMDSLSTFAGWEGERPERGDLAEFPEIAGGTLYLVDKPGAAQSQIRIGKRGIVYDATGDFYRSTLANYPLGGNFTSRVNLNLREDKGYTYGARTSFSASKDWGYFVASAGVRTDSTADSIREFEREIRGYAKDGIGEDELRFMRSAIAQSDARAYESTNHKASLLGRIQYYDLPEDFKRQQLDILSSVGAGELNTLAGKHFNFDDMILVVVGDKETILPNLEELGYDIVELDINGNPI